MVDDDLNLVIGNSSFDGLPSGSHDVVLESAYDRLEADLQRDRVEFEKTLHSCSTMPDLLDILTRQYWGERFFKFVSYLKINNLPNNQAVEVVDFNRYRRQQHYGESVAEFDGKGVSTCVLASSINCILALGPHPDTVPLEGEVLRDLSKKREQDIGYDSLHHEFSPGVVQHVIEYCRRRGDELEGHTSRRVLIQYLSLLVCTMVLSMYFLLVIMLLL